jgi:hypothetical protein
VINPSAFICSSKYITWETLFAQFKSKGTEVTVTGVVGG